MVLAYGGLSYAGLCLSHMSMFANHDNENYDLKLVKINWIKNFNPFSRKPRYGLE